MFRFVVLPCFDLGLVTTVLLMIELQLKGCPLVIGLK